MKRGIRNTTVVVASLILFAMPVLAQTPKTNTTTVASNKYGEGGTLETTSDEKLKLLKEVWKDKNGKVRERHELEYRPDGKLGSGLWYFYKENPINHEPPYTIEMKPDGENLPNGHYAYNGKWNLSQYNFGAKDESILEAAKTADIDKVMAEIEKQFAKDGTIPKITDDTAKAGKKPEKFADTQVEQPTLPKNETFTKTDDNEPKPSKSRATEPKTTEPPKETEPRVPKKADDSSTGFGTDIKQPPGLNTLIFTTPHDDRLELYLPNRIYDGLTFSATMKIFPHDASKGANDLNGDSVSIGDQFMPIKNGMFTITLPKTGNDETGLFLVDVKRKEKTGVTLPVYPSLPELLNGKFCLPRSGTSGGVFEIHGPFSGGVAPTDYLKIGGNDVQILSETARELVALNTYFTPGLTSLELGTNGSVYKGPFRNLKVDVTAGSTNLLKGASTTVHIVVSGLNAITKPANMSITASGPIALAGGNTQSLAISPGQVGADGTFSKDLGLTALERGNFGVVVTVKIDEPACSSPEKP